MNLLTILDMSVEGHGDRIAFQAPEDGGASLTGTQLRDQAFAAAAHLSARKVDVLAFVGESGIGLPLALFAASAARVPFLPLNYRLARGALRAALDTFDRVFLISDDEVLARAGSVVESRDLQGWTDLCLSLPRADSQPSEPDNEDVAVLLMTSGTISAPKSAVLRHRHISSYIVEAVNFSESRPDDATIVSVPPYHVAGISNLLSNLYSGRRVVYLKHFTPRGWLEMVARERVTHAMLVPTMLAGIVGELSADPSLMPSTLRFLAYGGSKIAPSVLRAALELMPAVDFVNAYGLTETASTIAVLGPEDHRAALLSSDPHVRARLGSVGRPLASVTIEIRDANGRPSRAGEKGLIFVKGAQVAGEYRDASTAQEDRGWFATRDEGYFDSDGYLFVQGRADDTIIRGGENIAPAEIEEVIHQHEAVAEVVVVGLPDEIWGQSVGAFVVCRPGVSVAEEEIRRHVRERLRSSKTPEHVYFLSELPHSPTGKIIRRDLLKKITAGEISAADSQAYPSST